MHNSLQQLKRLRFPNMIKFSDEKLKSILIEIEFANADQASFIIGKLNHYGFREVSRVDTNARLGKDNSKKIHNVIFDRV